MDEGTVTIIVAGLTFVTGPAIVAVIGKMGKRAANLETATGDSKPHCGFSEEQISVLVQSIKVLHQKMDLLHEVKLAEVLQRLREKDDGTS